uniref:Uncharacterized protein n=1 Tax=Ditylenchus dipsaci TaxID=166011 RepID=A0A915EGR4_9BILA
MTEKAEEKKSSPDPIASKSDAVALAPNKTETKHLFGVLREIHRSKFSLFIALGLLSREKEPDSLCIASPLFTMVDFSWPPSGTRNLMTHGDDQTQWRRQKAAEVDDKQVSKSDVKQTPKLVPSSHPKMLEKPVAKSDAKQSSKGL